MKRTPLKRKTAMRRSTKPMKRTAIRKVSVKRRAEARLYTVKRKAFLAAHPICQAYLKIWPDASFVPRSMHVHHVELRGPKYLDESTWLAVSSWAHTWIHSNARAARVLGLLK